MTHDRNLDLIRERLERVAQQCARNVLCRDIGQKHRAATVLENQKAQVGMMMTPANAARATTLLASLVIGSFTATAIADDAVEQTATAAPAPATPTPPATTVPAQEARAVTPPKETAKLDPEPAPTITSTTSAAPAEPRAVAKPPPYSLPWQLRPVTAGNALRSDTSVAFFDSKNAMTGESKTGATVSSMLLASYKLTPTFAPLVRMAYVYNDEPTITGAPPAGTAVVNPLVGATYATTLAGLKVAGFGAVTLPIGEGGGDMPDAAEAKATARAIPARSAMDNAMFAVNYATIIGGVGVAFVQHGFTGQIEATVLQLFKTRGPDMEDKARTNFTAGMHAGYFLVPQLSISGELRYQRWLSDAAPAVKDPTARETVTFAIGPRLNIKLEGKQWLRPGVSYSRALDAPFSTSGYQMVQLDIPYVF